MKREVRWVTSTIPDENGGQVSRYAPDSPDGWEHMDKKEFMKICEEFWDNHGTRINDFDILQVQLNRDVDDKEATDG